MTKKLEPCCARLQGRLVHTKGLLSRAAGTASRRASKGLPLLASHHADIASAKEEVAEAQQAIETHEADFHAGVPEAAAS